MNDSWQPIEPSGDSSTNRAQRDWKFRILGALAEPNTRRVFSTADFQKFVDGQRPGTSKSAVHNLMLALSLGGALRRVSSGLYLNGRCIPPVELAESAAHIRASAVISLHSVLGECGFLNNPSRIVMAVVPTSASLRPNLGEMKTSGGAVMRFYGLAERFFPNTDEDRFKLYQPGRHCDMFRPEAALLQWLYLARMQRSTLTDLPTNVDMTAVDREYLVQLAREWRLEPELQRWYGHASSLGFDEQKHNPTPPAPRPSIVINPLQVDGVGLAQGVATVVSAETPARAAAAAARARMMAKRKTTP